MKHCKMFVVALMLFITAMTACAPNQEKKENNATVTGNAGNFLIIRGHGFSKEKSDNKVIFGDVAAQVLRADADYLLVQVPKQAANKVQVVVAVGDHTSNAMLFEYSREHKLVAAVKDNATAAF